MAGLIVSQSLLDLWRELTNEKNTAVVPDATVYQYLQAGAEWLNRRTGYHLTDDAGTVVFVAGTQEYAAPVDLVELAWVEWNGKLLARSDVERWRSQNLDWRGEPAGFPKEVAFYGNKLVFRPAPSPAAVAAAASPVIRYVSTPPDLATFGPEQLATQDWRIIVYHAVGLWSSAFPDSPVAESRRDYFSQLADQESELIRTQYAARRVAR